MRIKKLIVTSMLAIAATSVATVTAHGEAAVSADPISLSGSDRGVDYSASLSKDHTGIVTHLSNGKFQLSPDGSAVTIAAPDGTAIEQLPMAIDAGGRQLRLDPEINSAGTTLTLRPADQNARVDDVAAFDSNVQDVALPQLMAAQPGASEIAVVGSAAGAVVGAIVGAVIGTLIGALFLLVGAIPGFVIGLVLGAIIGAGGGFFIVPA